MNSEKKKIPILRGLENEVLIKGGKWMRQQEWSTTQTGASNTTSNQYQQILAHAELHPSRSRSGNP